MDFEIAFAVLLSALAIINISPYSSLVYVLVSVNIPLSNWGDFWQLTIPSIIFAFFFRLTNPRR